MCNCQSFCLNYRCSSHFSHTRYFDTKTDFNVNPFAGGKIDVIFILNSPVKKNKIKRIAFVLFVRSYYLPLNSLERARKRNAAIITGRRGQLSARLVLLSFSSASRPRRGLISSRMHLCKIKSKKKHLQSLCFFQ